MSELSLYPQHLEQCLHIEDTPNLLSDHALSLQSEANNPKGNQRGPRKRDRVEQTQTTLSKPMGNLQVQVQM